MVSLQNVSVLLMPWGRVGSNVCTDILLQSMRVHIENEPLTVIEAQNPNIGREQLGAIQMKWLNENVQRRDDAEKIVLKLSALSIAEPEAFIKFLQETDATIIMMDRRDVLATAVSALRAAEYAKKSLADTGAAIWGLSEGMKADFKPLVEITDLRRAINNILKGRRICETIAAAIPVRITIWYEDLNQHFQTEVSRLIEALGLEPFTYEIRHVKFTPMPLRQAVANPAILKEVATEFNLPFD